MFILRIQPITAVRYLFYIFKKCASICTIMAAIFFKVYLIDYILSPFTSLYHFLIPEKFQLKPKSVENMTKSCIHAGKNEYWIYWNPVICLFKCWKLFLEVWKVCTRIILFSKIYIYIVLRKSKCNYIILLRSNYLMLVHNRQFLIGVNWSTVNENDGNGQLNGYIHLKWLYSNIMK